MIDCLEVEIVFDVVLTSCYVWIEFLTSIIYTLQNVFAFYNPKILYQNSFQTNQYDFHDQ